MSRRWIDGARNNARARVPGREEMSDGKIALEESVDSRHRETLHDASEMSDLMKAFRSVFQDHATRPNVQTAGHIVSRWRRNIFVKENIYEF